MAWYHFGNNLYFYRSSEGTTREDCPQVQKGVYIDIDSGKISNYTNNGYNDVNFGAKTDQIMIAITRQLTFTNIGTAYVDVFPAFYDGFPIPLDCNGFTQMGIVILWNKNGGTGIHDFRLVNHLNNTEVLVHTENIRVVNNWPQDGLKNGRTFSYNIPIPTGWVNFRGTVRLQVKSTVAADDPIFDGFFLYLIR